MQTSLFVYENIENLSTSQENNLAQYGAQEDVDTIYPVVFEELRLVQMNGIVSVSIPHHSCQSVDFKAKQVEYVDDDDYVWHGDAYPFDSTSDCGIGQLTLVRKDDKTYGLFEIGATSFLVYDLGQGINAIAEVSNEYDGFVCANTNNSGGGVQSGDNDLAIPRNPFNCFVNLLVVYQPEANIVDDIEYYVDTQVRLTNIALRNSAISTNQLRIFVVGIEEIDFDVINPTQPHDDLEIVADEVEPLRDLLEADIVIYITADDYTSADIDQDILGVALSNSMPSDLSEIDAYAMVERNVQATRRFVFSHELGHLFDCQHHVWPFTTINNGHFICWGFSPRYTRNTIMSVAPKVDDSDVIAQTILHFSNPKVKFHNKPTGLTENPPMEWDTRDNVRWLTSGAACEVATWNDGNDPMLSVGIQGESFGCPSQQVVELIAVIEGGSPGLLNIDWSISNDGINYQHDGDNATYWADIPDPGHVLFIRLFVESTSGQTATVFHTVQVGECTSGPIGLADGVIILVSPTISGDTYKVEIEIGRKGLLKANILDPNGSRIIAIDDELKQAGRYEYYIDMSKYPSGVYFVNAQLEDSFSSCILMKL